VAGILRVLTCILGFATSLLVTAASFKWITDLRIRKLVLWLNLFLWFIVFMDARFSSESWAGIFFFSGLALLIIKDAFYKTVKQNSLIFIIFCGFLLGLSLVFRLQMILLLPGLALWCLFVAKTPFKTLLFLLAGGILALALGFVADYLFYGNWVNTAYGYFVTNIMQGKAAEFGVSPWWFYIPEFLQKASLPLSFVIFALVILAWIRNPRNIFTLSCVPFVLLHMAIAHKELRFLFPIAHAMPVFLALGIQSIISYRSVILSGKWPILSFGLFAIMCIQNLLLLAKVSTSPVNDVLEPLSDMYRLAKKQEVNIIIADEYDYLFLQGLPMNFYVTPNMHLSKFSTADSIQTSLAQTQKPAYFLLRTRGVELPAKYQGLQANIVETKYEIPGWYKQININNWLSRTSFWRTYKLSAKP
jgi:phosphatidylinositol glycan class B